MLKLKGQILFLYKKTELHRFQENSGNFYYSVENLTMIGSIRSHLKLGGTYSSTLDDRHKVNVLNFDTA